MAQLIEKSKQSQKRTTLADCNCYCCCCRSRCYSLFHAFAIHSLTHDSYNFCAHLMKCFRFLSPSHSLYLETNRYLCLVPFTAFFSFAPLWRLCSSTKNYRFKHSANAFHSPAHKHQRTKFAIHKSFNGFNLIKIKFQNYYRRINTFMFVCEVRK